MMFWSWFSFPRCHTASEVIWGRCTQSFAGHPNAYGFAPRLSVSHHSGKYHPRWRRIHPEPPPGLPGASVW